MLKIVVMVNALNLISSFNIGSTVKLFRTIIEKKNRNKTLPICMNVDGDFFCLNISIYNFVHFDIIWKKSKWCNSHEIIVFIGCSKHTVHTMYISFKPVDKQLKQLTSTIKHSKFYLSYLNVVPFLLRKSKISIKETRISFAKGGSPDRHAMLRTSILPG
jgi:hypothetical protein